MSRRKSSETSSADRPPATPAPHRSNSISRTSGRSRSRRRRDWPPVSAEFRRVVAAEEESEAQQVPPGDFRLPRDRPATSRARRLGRGSRARSRSAGRRQARCFSWPRVANVACRDFRIHAKRNSAPAPVPIPLRAMRGPWSEKCRAPKAAHAARFIALQPVTTPSCQPLRTALACRLHTPFAIALVQMRP